MNLRQKAKKYKERMYQLEKMMNPKTVYLTPDNKKVITLSSIQKYHPEVITKIGEEEMEQLLKFNFARDIKDKLYEAAEKTVRDDKYNALLEVEFKLDILQ